MSSQIEPISCFHNNNEKISVSTHCKGCERDFTVSTVLTHILRNPSCKAAYCMLELNAFQEWKKERRNEKKRESYDPVKRREKHQKDKRSR